MLSTAPPAEMNATGKNDRERNELLLKCSPMLSDKGGGGGGELGVKKTALLICV